MNEALLRAFVEESDIIAPQSLVDETAEQMIREFLHVKRYENLAKGLAYIPEDIEQISQEIQNAAHLQIKTQLVLDDIIKTQAFYVTHDELEEEAKALAERQKLPLEAVKDFFGEDMTSLRQDILIKKAIAFITG